MKKLFSLLMLALLTLSVGAANTYVKVTSADQLEAGKKYILVVEKTYNKAMGTIGTYGAAIDVTVSEGVVDIDGKDVVELTLGGATGAWTFDAGNGNYLNWTSGNSLKTDTDATSPNSQWTVNSTDDGYVLNNVATADRKIQYNPGSPRFACYTSTQQPAVLYIQDASVAPPVTVAAPTLPAAQTFEESLTVTITNNEDGATLSYSYDNDLWTPYTEPLVLTETKTVYAKAEKNGVESQVVHQTYTKVDPTPEGVVDFVPSVDKGNGSTTRGEWTIVKNGVTIVCSDGTVYDENYRIYQGATLTFSTTEGNITKIEFTGGDNSKPISNLSTETGTLTTSGSDGVWEGTAPQIVFTASAQARASEIRVYVEDETVITVAAPTLPEEQTFYDNLTVAITNNEDGADLYYSYDNTEWNAYTEPLVLTETKTVFAKAEKNGVESNVVSATYTKIDLTGAINTLAEVNALNDSTEFIFGGDAVVTYQYNNYLFLRDATGYGLIYGNAGASLTNGQVLKRGWSAKKVTYRSLVEYTNPQNVSASDSTNTELAAVQTVTELDVNMVNAYVQFTNVVSISGTTATLSDGTTITLYKRFANAIPELAEGSYTVIGIVSIYNGAMQLYYIDYVSNATTEVAAPVFDPNGSTYVDSQEVTLTCETEGAEIYYSINDGEYQLYSAPFTLTETATVKAYAKVGDVQSAIVTAKFTKRVEVSNIAEANALDNKVDFIFNGNVIVTYQNGKNLWIRDGSGSGLIYGEQVPTFAQGTILAEEWTAQKYNFRGGLVPEFQYPNNVKADESMEPVTVEPFERTTLTNANVNEYVIMKGQTITAETNTEMENYQKYFYNADGLVLYNQFGVEFTLEEGKTYDVVGTVTVYNEAPQLYIIRVTEVEDEAMRGDLNGDGLVNTGDLSALITALLNDDFSNLVVAADPSADGLINTGDISALISFLLNGVW